MFGQCSNFDAKPDLSAPIFNRGSRKTSRAVDKRLKTFNASFSQKLEVNIYCEAHSSPEFGLCSHGKKLIFLPASLHSKHPFSAGQTRGHGGFDSGHNDIPLLHDMDIVYGERRPILNHQFLLNPSLAFRGRRTSTSQLLPSSSLGNSNPCHSHSTRLRGRRLVPGYGHDQEQQKESCQGTCSCCEEEIMKFVRLACNIRVSGAVGDFQIPKG